MFFLKFFSSDFSKFYKTVALIKFCILTIFKNFKRCFKKIHVFSILLLYIFFLKFCKSILYSLDKTSYLNNFFEILQVCSLQKINVFSIFLKFFMLEIILRFLKCT